MHREELPEGHWVMVREPSEVPMSLRRPVEKAYGQLSAATWTHVGRIDIAALTAGLLRRGIGALAEAPKEAVDERPDLAALAPVAAEEADVKLDLSKPPPSADGETEPAEASEPVEAPAKPGEVWLPPEVRKLQDEAANAEPGSPAESLFGGPDLVDVDAFKETWTVEDKIILARVAAWSFTAPVDPLDPDGPRRDIPVTQEGLDELPAYWYDAVSALFPNGLADLFPNFLTKTAAPTEPSSASS